MKPANVLNVSIFIAVPKLLFSQQFCLELFVLLQTPKEGICCPFLHLCCHHIPSLHVLMCSCAWREVTNLRVSCLSLESSKDEILASHILCGLTRTFSSIWNPALELLVRCFTVKSPVKMVYDTTECRLKEPWTF